MEKVYVVTETLPSGKKNVDRVFSSWAKAESYINEFCAEDRCNFAIEKTIFEK